MTPIRVLLVEDSLAIEKPAGPAITHLHAMGRELRRGVRELSGIRLRRRPSRLESPAAPLFFPRKQIDAIGIAASTGGPQALSELLGALPRDFPVPILVVQHISAGFDAGFLKWLGQQMPLPIRLARKAALLEPGVTLAPQGTHLILDRNGRIEFLDSSSGEYHVPSADALLSSMAVALGERAAGVILTGMGSDGAEGLSHLRAAGGLTIVQDEETSVIWGMPGAAVKRGAAMGQASPRQIAETLVSVQRSTFKVQR